MRYIGAAVLAFWVALIGLSVLQRLRPVRCVNCCDSGEYRDHEGAAQVCECAEATR